jgi:hypothetical protein
MSYDTERLPDDGDLAPWLRWVATQGFDERGDVGDFSPYDRVRRLYEASQGEQRDRLDDAFAQLLTEEGSLARLVLEQVSRFRTSFLPRLFRVMEGRCGELSSRRDTSRTDGCSLLGAIVETASLMVKVTRPSVALAHELAAFERPEDRWPMTFFLALPGDIEGLLPRFPGIVARLDDEALFDFASSMVGNGSPWTDVVFEAIGRGPLDVRDRCVNAVRRVTERMEETRAELAALKLDDPEQQALVQAAVLRPNPWPEFASRLGVSSG